MEKLKKFLEENRVADLYEIKNVEEDGDALRLKISVQGAPVVLRMEKRKVGPNAKETYIALAWFSDYVRDKSSATEIAEALSNVNETNAKFSGPAKASIDSEFDLAISGVFWQPSEAPEVLNAISAILFYLILEPLIKNLL